VRDDPSVTFRSVRALLGETGLRFYVGGARDVHEYQLLDHAAVHDGTAETDPAKRPLHRLT